ncbi:MAG: hypothetical protein NWR72_08405 [Bacteroidia bacterium]|nr:hypothetical protein [Bacteroidia bacterium]
MNTNLTATTFLALSQSPLLREVWSRYLEEKTEDETANPEEVVSLDASCLPIEDLSDFTIFKNLRTLDLSFSAVRDLSPLADMPFLEELHLTFHIGGVLLGLEKLAHLRILDLSYPRSAIRELDRVSDLDNLEELYMNGCGVRTVAHVVPLEKLRILTLSFNCIPKAERDAFRVLSPACALLD